MAFSGPTTGKQLKLSLPSPQEAAPFDLDEENTMPTTTCVTCLYNNNGFCHAAPPRMLPDPSKIDDWPNKESVRFPIVLGIDLACTEYKKK